MSTVAEVAGHADQLRALDLRITRTLDGILSGEHRGLLPGPGSEAGDARAYEPGDDARRIDWALTARAGSTQVRDTIAEHELETWLVVDGTASLDFGTARCEKRDLALAATAAFGLLTARGGNRVGAMAFDGERARITPPRAGRPATLALLRQLQERPRSGGGADALAGVLRRWRAVARRRALLVVVSDLLDGSDWPAQLRMAGARHDVVVAEVVDPREDELPPVGLLTLVDPETGRRFEVASGDARLRERFAVAAAERRVANRAAVRAAGAAHLTLSTDRDWLLDVVRFTLTRRRVR